MRSFLILGLALAGCNSDGSGDLADAPTFHRDVAPLVDKYCARCHDGHGLGPGDFRDYATAQSMSALMISRIDAGEMPPPAADPACHDYENSERLFMDPADRDVIAAWVDAGAPEGDPADAVESVWPEPHLADADHELSVAAPYTPDFDGNNEYRCFILDWDEAEDLYVTGLEPLIDNASISHHTLLFVASDGDAEGYVTDPATRSWKCGLTPDNNWSYLHAWAPGNNPIELPDGLGVKVPGGSQLVLQMHYYRSGPDADSLQDQPGYAIRTAPSVAHEVYYFPVGPDDFTIPAGDDHHTETLSFDLDELFGFEIQTKIYGVFPHMHVLGSGYDFHATTPEGEEECIARSDRYDFSNQPTYAFPEPVVLGGADNLSISCTWNNSTSNPDRIVDPPQDTQFGEGTDEEMCYALMYLSFGA